MKIHPLHHGVLFILQYLPFSFSVPLKRQKIMKEGVDELAPLLIHKTAACTDDIISYESAVNTVNRCNDFLHACTLLHHELRNRCQYSYNDKDK